MPRDPLSRHFMTMACNNAWANHRLLRACEQLTQAEFAAIRVSFFPSIKATLNHNLTVDWFYVDALEREARGDESHPDVATFFKPAEPCGNCRQLGEEQRAVDRRLMAYCAALTDAGLGRVVTILRPRGIQRDTRTRLLAHLFQHQIHHRGQAHAMLAGTTVKPPQLDDFFCAGDAPLRAGDLAALGLSEAAIWGPQADAVSG